MNEWWKSEARWDVNGKMLPKMGLYRQALWAGIDKARKNAGRQHRVIKQQCNINPYPERQAHDLMNSNTAIARNEKTFDAARIMQTSNTAAGYTGQAEAWEDATVVVGMWRSALRRTSAVCTLQAESRGKRKQSYKQGRESRPCLPSPLSF